MIDPFPKSRLARLFERAETFARNPDMLARNADNRRRKKSFAAERAEAEKYCTDVGLKDILVAGDQSEISPVYLDLSFIHKLIRTRKPENVVEFGVGFSTLAIGHALSMNGSGQLFTVDANEHWLDNTLRKLPDFLTPVVTLTHSPVRCHLLEGQLCSLYDQLPNVRPDFVYLDAPSGSDVQGAVHGLNFNMNGTHRPAIAADPLLYESTASRTFFMLVDGRARNVEFLRANLKARYRFHQSSILKQSYFERI